MENLSRIRISLWFSVVFSFVLILIQWSCTKAAEGSLDNELTIMRQIAKIEEVSEEAYAIAQEAYALRKLDVYANRDATQPSAVVSKFDSITKVDFGMSKAMGKDKKYRNGIILYKYVRNGILTVNSTSLIELVGYQVNGIIYTGQRSSKYMGLNSDSLPYFSIITQIRSIDTKKGDSVFYRSERFRTQIAGHKTTSISDDIYESKGINDQAILRGVRYSLFTDVLLRWNSICTFFQEGLLKIKGNNGTEYSIDFSAKEISNCDPYAKFNYGKKSEVLHLIL